MIISIIEPDNRRSIVKLNGSIKPLDRAALFKSEFEEKNKSVIISVVINFIFIQDYIKFIFTVCVAHLKYKFEEVMEI